MPRQGRMGSAAAACLEPSETMSIDTATMMPDRSALSESAITAATVRPTESEIAIVAYQLWLDNGCPVGSDQEHWFRAEEMLGNTLIAKCEDLSKPPSILRGDARIESEMLPEFRWEGHWEVWETELLGARWIWDSGRSRR